MCTDNKWDFLDLNDQQNKDLNDKIFINHSCLSVKTLEHLSCPLNWAARLQDFHEEGGKTVLCIVFYDAQLISIEYKHKDSLFI